MTSRRFELIKQKLAQRQPDLTVVMDHVHKPHNFSAILRSCDAVGVDTAHMVTTEKGIRQAQHISQGADKWVEVKRYETIEEATAILKQRGFNLCAAHLAEQPMDFRQVDFTQPTAIILGTEKSGVSEQALAATDQIITIPMQGMVESLNVSVAAALILFEAQRQRLASGFYERRRLDDPLYQRRLIEWYHPQIAHHCRQYGLPFPDLDEDGQVIGPLPGSAGNPFSD